MNEEYIKVWEEIREYVVTNNETCDIELKKGTPKEIQEKFEYWRGLEDDEFIITKNIDKKTQN